MDTTELLLLLLVGGVVLFIPFIAIVLSIIAMVKSRRIADLSARIVRLESQLRVLENTSTPKNAPVIESQQADANVKVVSSEPAERPNSMILPQQSESAVRPAATRSLPPVVVPRQASQLEDALPVGWETFIGQKAFGWLAAVLFVFSAAFFLRYAYQNNWIGPVGRVAIGELIGAGLVVAGFRYLLGGWRRYGAMIMSTGITVVYLSTYSAFGFYQLLPQHHAGFFLTVLILESMAAAVVCRSWVIGLVSVLGGLLTPLLMQSDHDNFASFFLYLIILNLSVAVALCLQRWRFVGSVSFTGTQFLYWSWYEANYHPEKFGWALGLQLTLFSIYFIQQLLVARFSTAHATREEVLRFAVNGVVGFIAFNSLTREYWSNWLGTASLTAATIYALAGRWILAWRPRDSSLLLTSMALAAGFIVWAIPLQADARWIALGWMAIAFSLWLFGLRVASPMLRAMAAVMACLAVGRLVFFDLPLYVRDPFLPVFNRIAFPSVLVCVLLLTAVRMSDRYLTELGSTERSEISIAGATGTILLWLILSLECHGYFVSQSMLGGDVSLWRWRAQLALTVFWILFAILLMGAGFRLNRSRLRWLAMGLFTLTALKLFVVDMANVQQIYRIAAFFILAVVLGFVARAYQRFRT